MDPEDEESLSRRWRAMVPPIPGLEGVVEAATPMLDKLSGFFDMLKKALNDIVLGFVNPTQQRARKDLTSRLEAGSASFSKVATDLGLDAALGEDLSKLCGDASQEAFGMMGMSTDKADTAQILVDLQERLEQRITRALVDKYGRQYDDGQRADMARAAAAAITGINTDDLNSTATNGLIAQSPPTSGYGAMLFGIRQNIESKTAIVVGEFTLEQTNLAAAQSVLTGRGTTPPPGTPETAPRSVQEQAQIHMTAAIERGVTFRDVNRDGTIDIKDLERSLQGKTLADIDTYAEFEALVTTPPPRTSATPER